MFDRIVHSGYKINAVENSLWYILLGLVDIINGLVRVLTLGQISTDLDFRVLEAKMQRKIQKMKEERDGD